MNTCIYCGEEKNDNEFTLEHVIPQSLGGAHAPDKFKTRDVCEKCNGTLGLFVDAAFERDWFVQNWLRMSAMAFFDPDKPSSLPLICMGSSSLVPPGINDDEVCESWIGPLGEQVFWIRKHDEKLYWYVGGNPRTSKDSESRAYFLFSERSMKNPIISWLSFRDAFRDRKKVKKIMCTEVHGEDPKDIGFSSPDAIDVERIAFFKSLSSITNGEMKNQLSFNVNFDQRFMAKLGIGIGYCLFGKKVLETEYGRELRKGLWQRESVREGVDVDVAPQLRGASAWMSNEDKTFKNIVGEEHAVCLIILPTGDGVVVNINIGKTVSCTVMCASSEGLNSEELDYISGGKVILLYKHLKTSVTLSLLEYVAYKVGNFHPPRLAEINDRISKNKGYFKNL
jgi:hypothetical protein